MSSSINKKLIKLYNKIYPDLESIGEYSFSKNEKIKIGFISEFFSDHTIAKLFKGIIYKLNKENFEVYVFHSNKTLPGKIFNEINESVVSYNYENIILPKDFYEKVKTIRDKNGVALSSRNFLLSIKEKKIASKIYKLIINNKKNLFIWYEGGDSNPHARRHWILNPARIPVPPPSPELSQRRS